MRSRLFTILSALSLLLCIAVVVLWGVSHSEPHYVARAKLESSSAAAVSSRVYRVIWTRGSIRLGVGEQTYYPRGAPVPPAPDEPTAHWGLGRLGRADLGWQELPERSFWNRLGFHQYEQRSFSSALGDDRFTGIALPAWLLVTVLSLPPLAWAACAPARSAAECGRAVALTECSQGKGA